MADFFKKEEVQSKLLENSRKFNSSSINSNAQNNSKSIFNIDNKKIHPSMSLLENLGNRIGTDIVNNKYVNMLAKDFNECYRREPSSSTVTQEFNKNNTTDNYIRERLQVQNLVFKSTLEKQLTDMGLLSNKKCLVCDELLF